MFFSPCTSYHNKEDWSKVKMVQSYDVFKLVAMLCQTGLLQGRNFHAYVCMYITHTNIKDI